MKRFLIAILLLLAPASGLPADESWQGVQKVYDGDTFKLKGGEKVRLLGIDTPELHHSEKLYRDAQRSRQDAKKIRKLGAQSFEVTNRLLKGRPVRIAEDESVRDEYGRTLAYVYFKIREDRFAKIVGQSYSGKVPASEKEYMLNRELVRYGWASVYKSSSFHEKKEFLRLEREAREKRWGLWRGAPPTR